MTPLKEFYVTLSKKRENNLRVFLYINFAIYYIYITTMSYNGEKYLYMVKVSSAGSNSHSRHMQY